MPEEARHPDAARLAGRGPGRSLGLVLALAALGVACFDGADAQGLPCRSDEDCGLGQSCDQGFCGGPPATGTATTDGTSSSTAVVDSSSGSETSPPAACGNAEVDEQLGEECDPGTGLDTAECNADCTAARCGDGYPNPAAGEDCDDANDTDLDECTTACRSTVFWDDLSQDPLASGDWTAEIPVHGRVDDRFMLDSGWVWGVPEPGVLSSGLYSEDAGTARIVTRPIMFPEDPGPGFQYELRFRHRLRFDGNMMDWVGTGCSGPLMSDGGVVLISDAPGGPTRPAGPPMNHPDELADPGACVDSPDDHPNPLYDPIMPRPAYSGISPPDLVDVGFVLPDVAGQTVQLIFEVGYDCFNCWLGEAPLGAGWTIDDVVVAPFPMGG